MQLKKKSVVSTLVAAGLVAATMIAPGHADDGDIFGITNTGILPKLLIITVISLPSILVLYGLLVKPFNIMRFFFGMRPRKVRGKTA